MGSSLQYNHIILEAWDENRVPSLLPSSVFVNARWTPTGPPTIIVLFNYSFYRQTMSHLQYIVSYYCIFVVEINK